MPVPIRVPLPGREAADGPPRHSRGPRRRGLPPPSGSAHVGRRQALTAIATAAIWPSAQAADTPTPAHASPRTLRYAFSVAETGFDPAQISDIYSRYVTAHIFETPLAYDHLARPYKLRPCTAAAMPEISDNFTTFVFRIRPGIYFADDLREIASIING